MGGQDWANEMIQRTSAQLIAVVDLDGVIASYCHGTFDNIGPPILGAREFLEKIHERGFYIVIHTCRCSPSLYPPHSTDYLRGLVEDWLNDNDMIYDEVWDQPGKPLGHVYVDDRAVSCRPEHNPLAFERAEAKMVQLAAGIQETTT